MCATTAVPGQRPMRHIVCLKVGLRCDGETALLCTCAHLVRRSIILSLRNPGGSHFWIKGAIWVVNG
jgi:hypothetical protein